MLKKKNRIPATEIREIFSGNFKNIQSDFFLLKKRENNLGTYRFAVIVSAKIYKTSVKRHQIKRKIVSILEKINDLSGQDFVLTIKKDIAAVSAADLELDLGKILVWDIIEVN